MALASSSANSLLGCSQPPSLSTKLHTLPSRQVWQRKGGLFVSATSAGTEVSSEAPGPDETSVSTSTSRRQLVSFPVASICACLVTSLADKGMALASEFADMPALRGKDYGKSKMKYPDYVETESGLQYKDLRPGSGPPPKAGNMVVIWQRKGEFFASALEDSSRASASLLPASWSIQHRVKPRIVAVSSKEGDETEGEPSTVTETAKPVVSERRAKAEAEVAKGQRTAIVTGAISVLLGVAYLVLIQLLDTRGVILVPPPPEAFNP